MSYEALGEVLGAGAKFLMIVALIIIPFSAIGMWVCACWFLEWFVRHWH